ncbi:acetolactate synthase large subunit [Saccharopolyspora griseoalba]|uniref:Acetolactate synthase large subunit n=1 Tax=Saccharopolyspora griseoalba TaxID=1431848 RepID=A0ABW2LEE9_9PSEU
MKGSESLLETAVTAGIEVCFANPGTTEIDLVEAFDQVRAPRSVLALSEGVVTGAADGYGRMSGAPAMTLMHLGPGLANGIANLHNARRARTPVINVIGDHASWHQPADAPLASDIESLARPVSGRVVRTTSAQAASGEFATAWAAALQQRLPSTLITAADHMWSQGGEPTQLPAIEPRPAVDEQRVAEVAKVVAAGRRPAFLLGDDALDPEGVRVAARIAANAGGVLLCERGAARIERGPGVPVVDTLPYFPEDVFAVLEDFSDLVLIGARKPVAFFGYKGMPSHPLPEVLRVRELAGPDDDVLGALRALAAATDSAATEPLASDRPEVPEPTGRLNAEALAAAIVRTQPENSILVNEGVSSAAAYPAVAASAPVHTELSQTGGAIGMGMPVATGAAIACPDRSVINLQADGSAAYTVQALWTQAREGLDVTTVICANSRYRILEGELQRAGVDAPGLAASGMTSLGNPIVDWVAVSQGFGVPAHRATTAEELVEALRRAHAEPGPTLVEAVL